MDPQKVIEVGAKAADAAASGVDNGNVAWLILSLIALLLFAALAALWINKRGAAQRGHEDPLSTAPGVYAMRREFERLDNHLKEGFHSTHAMVRDVAHGLDETSQQVEYVRDDLKEVRDEVHELMQQIKGRTHRGAAGG